MSLPLNVEELSDRPLRIRVVGEVDISNAARFRELLAALAARDSTRLEIDLAGLRFMDCSGIVPLRSLATADRTVVLLNPRPLIRTVLELVGVVRSRAEIEVVPQSVAAFER